MPTIRHSPGPAAAEAFTFGIATTTAATLAGVWFLFSVGLLAMSHVIFAVVVGLPILLVVASCLLSIWLGYTKDAVDVALS